jgi:DNA recombination protein RmuC
LIYAAIGIVFILLCVVAWLQFRILSVKSAGIEKEEIKQIFSGVAMDVLKQQKEIGGAELDQKKELINRDITANKQLIDESIKNLNEQIKNIQSQLSAGNSTSATIAERLKNAGEAFTKLEQTTTGLRQILGSSQKRGEWGQRTAQDLFNLMGLTETVNYTTQQKEGEGKPDFTFFLPNNKRVNIDAKFPLDNYARYVEASSDMEKEKYKAQFLRDARQKVKELLKRGYINTEAGTVDYMIMFIPNEQVYGFINEYDRAFIDDAMAEKVVCCGPFALYAILATIREAMSNFNMERAVDETRTFMAEFREEWERYRDVFDSVGASLDDAHEKFDSLRTTRTRKLDRVLEKIEGLKGREPGEEKK